MCLVRYLIIHSFEILFGGAQHQPFKVFIVNEMKQKTSKLEYILHLVLRKSCILRY